MQVSPEIGETRCGTRRKNLPPENRARQTIDLDETQHTRPLWRQPHPSPRSPRERRRKEAMAMEPQDTEGKPLEVGEVKIRLVDEGSNDLVGWAGVSSMMCSTSPPSGMTGTRSSFLHTHICVPGPSRSTSTSTPSPTRPSASSTKPSSGASRRDKRRERSRSPHVRDRPTRRLAVLAWWRLRHTGRLCAPRANVAGPPAMVPSWPIARGCRRPRRRASAGPVRWVATRVAG